MLRTSFRPTFATVAVTAFLFAGTAAHAAVERFTASLAAASEVPPNDSKGTGTLTATYNTNSKMLSFTITYSGLSGAATAAHFHGPADPGTNAGVLVPIPADLLASPIKGEVTLTDAIAANLEAGKLYFNIHTAANKGGEIRGQVMKK